MLGLNGDEDTINEARKRFDDHVDGKLINADLRSAVYSSVLTEADDVIFQKVIDLHNSADLQEEKMRIAQALGAVKDEKLIKKVLEFSISDAVRSQDSVTIICAVSANVSSNRSADIAWNFIKENWPTLYKRYSTGFILTRLVKSSTEIFATHPHADDIAKFFEKNPVPAAQRSVKQGLESIRINSAWLERDRESAKTFLSSY